MGRIWQAQLYTIYLTSIVNNPFPSYSPPTPKCRRAWRGRKKLAVLIMVNSSEVSKANQELWNSVSLQWHNLEDGCDSPCLLKCYQISVCMLQKFYSFPIISLFPCKLLLGFCFVLLLWRNWLFVLGFPILWILLTVSLWCCLMGSSATVNCS